MHEYPKYSHLETTPHNLDPNLRNHPQSQHNHHDFVNFLTFLQSHKTSPTSSVAAHINASMHQYKSIPCFDELLEHATSNYNTYSNTSLNLKYTDPVRQGHFEDDHLSLVNFMQNSTSYIRSLMKSSGCDHLLSSYLKNNIILPSIIEQSKRNEIPTSFPLPLSSTSSVTTKVPSSVSWINQLTELYPAYTQEMSVIDCIYKTFTSLLKNSAPSDNKNDENDFMFSGLNGHLNLSNIQNQINHSYFQNDTGSIYDEVRNCASNIEHPLVNNGKECYTSVKMLSKLYDNCPIPDYKSQMITVHNKNCKTHKSSHHNKLNNLARSSSSSLGFPLFNPFVESGTMGANSRKILSNHSKKCSTFHDKMFSNENVTLNPISPWSNLSNQKTNTNLSCSSVNYNDDKQENCNNLKITEQLKLYKENDSKNCVRLVNGQKKTRDDLSVSDFIASAIKYDNLNNSVQNNGALIEALASTNNLEMCWVKVAQIKENFENDICNLSSELVFIHSSKRHHLLVGISEKSGSKQASRMLWPHFNAKSFNVDTKLALSVKNDYPFYVYGHGWSSVDPNLTWKQQHLLCRQLQIEDICLVLTYCVPSTGKSSRISTIKANNIKLSSSNEINHSKCGLQSSFIKAVKPVDTEFESDSLSLTYSKKKINGDIISEPLHKWATPLNLKYDPHHSPSTLSSLRDEMKRKQYDDDTQVIKRPKLEAPFQTIVKSSSSTSHPFSACNLAKSPDTM